MKKETRSAAGDDELEGMAAAGEAAAADEAPQGKHGASGLKVFHKEEFPFYWVARIHALYTREMTRALKSVDCDIPTWRVLSTIHDHGVCSISEIATHAIGELSTITKVVYRMKADGLVNTETAPHDGRVTHVSLTDAGERALQRVQDATRDLFKRSFAGLSPTKMKQLNDRLRVIFENLER